MAITFNACSNARQDEELAAAAQRELVASAVLNAGVTVKDGVATLTGECGGEPCRTDAAAKLDSIDGITSVINKIVIKAPVVTP